MRVLDADDPCRWISRPVGPDRRVQLVEVEHAARVCPDRVEGNSAQGRRAAALVPEDVGFVPDNRLVAAATVRQQGGQIAHGSARYEHRGVLAEQPGGAFLQQVDRWVLTVLIVPHQRGGHCLPHCRRGTRHRVGAEIDWPRCDGGWKVRHKSSLRGQWGTCLDPKHAHALTAGLERGDPRVSSPGRS